MTIDKVLEGLRSDIEAIKDRMVLQERTENKLIAKLALLEGKISKQSLLEEMSSRIQAAIIDTIIERL